MSVSQMKAIVDRLLTGVSVAYIPDNFVCEQVLPPVYSANTTGKLAGYGSSFLRIENSVKGGRGKYRQVEPITRTTTSFEIDGHGLEGMVTKEDYKNVVDPFNAEADETLGLTIMLWIEKEKILADTLTDTSIMTQNNTLSGGAQWNDFANSDPIADSIVARASVLNGCGKMPNGVIMDTLVFNTIRFHPAFLEALGYRIQRPGGLLADELAMALGVTKIYLADARYNSAKEGHADSLAAVWGKSIVFGVFPDAAQKYQVSVGYMVRYEAEQPRQVFKQALFNPPGSSAILVEDNYDMLISNALAGYLIKNVIA